jgi:hypothetical protein
MDIVLIILMVAGGLIGFLLVLALVLPKHYSVTVAETINQPKSVVYDYVRLLGNQPFYSEWLKADPDLKPWVEGEDGKVGAVLKWESYNEDKNKNVGMGEQEIKGMDDNSIEVELRLIKPMAGTCKLENIFVEVSKNQTTYTCTFSAYARFPINLPSYLIGRHFIRKNQQQTLRNVKDILEQ